MKLTLVGSKLSKNLTNHLSTSQSLSNDDNELYNNGRNSILTSNKLFNTCQENIIKKIIKDKRKRSKEIEKILADAKPFSPTLIKRRFNL